MAPALQRTDTSVSELDSMPTPALTRQNTELSEPSTPPPSTPTAEEDEPLASNSKSKDLDPGTGKKLKITASNGWEARWKLEEREMRKRVKRARSSMSLEEEGRPLLRHEGSWLTATSADEDD
ncbi:hypothetical protein NMY22_g1456 [Coprinellus aureogranulatus]|nr:hypothetical protein NMY22_g1456 [Coprinellus aureogranulatus]